MMIVSAFHTIFMNDGTQLFNKTLLSPRKGDKGCLRRRSPGGCRNLKDMLNSTYRVVG